MRTPSPACRATPGQEFPGRVCAARYAQSVVVILLAVLGASTSQAQMHDFTGANGQIIPGEVISARDGEVVVKRTDGKAFSLDLPTLSPADRAYVQTWKAAVIQPKDTTATTESDIEITVTLEPTVPTEKNPAPGTFTPKVNLHNRETRANFKGLKGTLVLVGQASNNPLRFKVLAVEKFATNLPADGKYDLTGQPSTESPGKADQPAYHYRGYFFVLQNAEDNIIQLRRSGPFMKTGAEVLKLKTDSVFLMRPTLGAYRRRPVVKAAQERWTPLTSVLPLHVQP